MNLRSFAITTPIFFFALVLQEAIFNQFRLPATGFTFFLVVAFIWSALSTPEIGGLTGFLAGFLLDLTQQGDGPFGLWTLVLTVVCYGIAFFGYGDDRIHANASSIVFITVGGVALAQIVYLVLTAILGRNVGSFFQILLTLVGTSIWNLLVAPFIFPLTRWSHDSIFEGRTQP